MVVVEGDCAHGPVFVVVGVVGERDCVGGGGVVYCGFSSVACAVLLIEVYPVSQFSFLFVVFLLCGRVEKVARAFVGMWGRGLVDDREWYYIYGAKTRQGLMCRKNHVATNAHTSSHTPRLHACKYRGRFMLVYSWE